jgi:peptide/nickel transport system substrate-binding protein
MMKGLCILVGLLIALTLQVQLAHAQKTTFVVALNQDPDILDPTLSRTYVGRIIYEHMCEKLYELDENLRIFPQLAAELPEFSDGGKTVTIKLRQGVKFNDGTPMDAEAVRFSLDRHLNTKGSECVKKSAREDHIPIDCSASVCDEDCNNDAAEDTT